jgi:hypothetical protein
MIDQLRVNAEEETLRQRVRGLPDAARARFYADVGERLRDPDTYAVLNYSLICGIHHLYLRRYALWLFELVLSVLGIVLLVTPWLALGAVLLLALLGAECYCLFRSQLIVQDYNNRVMREVLAGMGFESVAQRGG